MGVQFFLGEPPAHIKQWIVDNNQPPLGFWKQIVKNLETEPEQTKQDITSTDQLVAGVLPSVGSTIPVDYKIDPNGDAVATEWMILGYNMSIPSVVKYVNGNNAVYVRTTSDSTQLLTSITAGASVYADKNSQTLVGTVSSVGSGTFTYGNNCTYSVPTSVTVKGVEYTFAGYNMTIQSRYILAIQDGGTLYHNTNFGDVSSTNSNLWFDSKIRTWMNGSEVYEMTWWQVNYEGESQSIKNNIVGLGARLTDTDFVDAVIPTVNRTWVHPNQVPYVSIFLDENQCQHVQDKFWLLGAGNMNCKGDYTTMLFPDGGASVNGQNIGYDTSRFTVFTENDMATENPSRSRNLMSVTGGDSQSFGVWWGRSACQQDYQDGESSYETLIGVAGPGDVYNYPHQMQVCGCLPACTIG